MCFMARGDVDVVLEELGGQTLVDGFSLASSRAIRMRFRQNMPIQPVASDCSRRDAVGQLVAAVQHGDVVQPEEAALEDVVAFAVDLVDPPGEVDQQLVEAASPGSRGRPCRARIAIHVVDPPDGPGVDRRIEVGELPLVGRESGRWGAGTARTAAPRAGPWRTWGRPARAATQWNARSQAANQGYSHLSGSVMTRIELRCRQCWLRMLPAQSGGGQSGLSPSSQRLTSNR